MPCDLSGSRFFRYKMYASTPYSIPAWIFLIYVGLKTILIHFAIMGLFMSINILIKFHFQIKNIVRILNFPILNMFNLFIFNFIFLGDEILLFKYSSGWKETLEFLWFFKFPPWWKKINSTIFQIQTKNPSLHFSFR